jgi:hypothetical protein
MTGWGGGKDKGGKEPHRGYPVAYADSIKGYELDKVPMAFWRKLELIYPAGKEQVTLVYVHEAEREIIDVMWQLQVAAGKGWFRLFVTTADGQREEAPGLRRVYGTDMNGTSRHS